MHLVRKLIPIVFRLRLDRLFRRKGCIILCFHGIGNYFGNDIKDRRFYSETEYGKIIRYMDKRFKDRYLLTYDDGFENVKYLKGIKFINTANCEYKGYINKTEAIFLKCGSHSNNHLYLPYLELKLLWDELATSRNILKTDYLAFPFGAYNEKVKQYAFDAGYKFLFGTDCNDPQVYPRFVISNTTTYESNILRMLVHWPRYRVSHLPYWRESL